MSQTIKLSANELTDEKSVEVSMLPLRAYGDLLKALQGTFKSLVSEFDGVETDELVERLPLLLAENLDEAAKIIEVGTRGQVTAEELLDQRGLADAVSLMTAILVENDVEGITNSVKKAMAAFQSRKAQAQTQS
jgi:hypothetical protein